MQGASYPPTDGERVKSLSRSADEKQLSRLDSIPTTSLLTTSNPYTPIAVNDDEQRVEEFEEEREEEERKKDEWEENVKLQSVEERVDGKLIVMQGSVGGRSCRDMLVDCGATACFVRRRWAESRKLPITPLSHRVTVTLADTSSQLRAVDEVRAVTKIRGSAVSDTRMLVLDNLPHDVICNR